MEKIRDQLVGKCVSRYLSTLSRFAARNLAGKYFTRIFFSGDSLECSLPLQMLLYFDAIFFPFWALTIGSVFHIKVK